MDRSKKTVIVVGAGLVGSVAAIRMAQLGYEVSLFDSRSDMRKTGQKSGRSINLALSDRGLKTLRLIEMEEAARNIAIPMYGRMLHDEEGNTRLARYSGRESEYINSISRSGLNELLLDKIDTYPNITSYFNYECISVDLQNNTAIFYDEQFRTVDFIADLIIGADGANSAVRASMLRHAASLRFSFSQQFLEHSYKELSISPGEKEKFQIEKNALHIWPRGDYMLIALPNTDGSFTVTLFMRTLGNTDQASFDKLKTADDIKDFFKEHFADAYPLLYNLIEEMEKNPVGALRTVKCSPWYVNDSVFLLGDSAHAVVPFYAQGMNCGFEDVYVLNELIEKNNHQWDVVLPEFYQSRKINADAIADLSLDNFYEMRDQVAHEGFAKKRDIEMQLEAKYEEYSSKYSMVTFREDLPYHVAMNVGRFQDALLLNMVQEEEEHSIEEIMAILKEETRKTFPDYKIYEE